MADLTRPCIGLRAGATLFLMTLTGVVCVGSVLAQSRLEPDHEYESLIDAYRAGRTRDAVATLAEWPAVRARSAVRPTDRSRPVDVSRTKAAVMLHTDVAFLVTGANARLSDAHLDIARSIVRTLPGVEGRFRERWDAHVVAAYLLRGDRWGAASAVNRGLAAYPNNQELRLLLVVVREGNLLAAGPAYQRIVANYPEDMPARLRLGRLYFAGNSRERAREHLGIVRARATDADLIYLAHLFLGALEEAENKPEAALREYESAHAIQPGAQSGIIALIRAARMTGRIDQARALATAYATQPAPVYDPWWNYSWGVTGLGSARWLHEEALTP